MYLNSWITLLFRVTQKDFKISYDYEFLMILYNMLSPLSGIYKFRLMKTEEIILWLMQNTYQNNMQQQQFRILFQGEFQKWHMRYEKTREAQLCITCISFETQNTVNIFSIAIESVDD